MRDRENLRPDLKFSDVRHMGQVAHDTAYSIIPSVAKAHRLLDSMSANPKWDWTPDSVKTVARRYNLTLRQSGTGHAVLTDSAGRHLTIPMHKPIKPLDIKRLVELIKEAS